MTACVQNEKLNAKSSPNVRAMRARTSGVPVCPSPHQGIIQRSMLEASKVVAPTAKAPQKPLKRLISQAALPRGRSWNNHARIVQSG